MPAIRSICQGGIIAVLVTCAACRSTGGSMAAREEIANILGQQAAAWNRGDVDAFMQPYWHSSDLSFSSGGRVTRGWDSTRERYRQRYPTREAMGRLTFSELEITKLGDGAALVLGRWRLKRKEPVGGAFTLVLRKLEGRWIIIHDHTSRDDQ